MKIVHSFWSKPVMGDSNNYTQINMGWRHPKYHYMSWALSCLTSREHYDQVELVTDRRGEHIFLEQLKLPYTSVQPVLDRLNQYPENLWAIGKLYAYQLQQEPFIHIDGDVFIWSPFEKRLEKAELVGQHVDEEEGHYHFGITHLKNHNIKLLPEFEKDFDTYGRFNATNAGIIGGNNIEFFREYVDRSFYFIDKNLDKTSEALIGSSFALIYEQYLYSVMARKKNIRIRHLLHGINEDILNLSDFYNRFGKKKFVHLLSKTKSHFECCRELELHLLTSYPEHHARILHLFKT